MGHSEVEFKYNADDITLDIFTKFCRGLNKAPKVIYASGYDYFYASKGDVGAFWRHRVSPDSNLLTFKRKNNDKNNFVRVEVNLKLDLATSVDDVAALCDANRCPYQGSIFKNCFIYVYDWYTLVYYICYDQGMKELGRFIEIEMSEEHPWQSEQEAFEQLLVMEKLCKPLGLTPQGRIRRSLFEMYSDE